MKKSRSTVLSALVFVCLAVFAALPALSAQAVATGGNQITADIPWSVLSFKSTTDWATKIADVTPVALVQDNALSQITINVGAKKDVELAIYNQGLSNQSYDLSKFSVLNLVIVNPSQTDLQFTIYGGNGNEADYKPSSKFKDKMLKPGENKVSCKLSSLPMKFNAIHHLIVQIYSNASSDVNGVIIKNVTLE